MFTTVAPIATGDGTQFCIELEHAFPLSPEWFTRNKMMEVKK